MHKEMVIGNLHIITIESNSSACGTSWSRPAQKTATSLKTLLQHYNDKNIKYNIETKSNAWSDLNRSIVFKGMEYQSGGSIALFEHVRLKVTN